ncbi:MAG: hypothetical protein LBH76_05430 [Propionibacteriaceae bacterium]|jgi:hypothetical protein|nr:hypothetical protein [Propionibacteriaceae bacterium]
MNGRPSDEDRRFAEIVEREFSQTWRPPEPAPAPPDPAPAGPASTPPAAPEPFELNLFDDDESYRRAPSHFGPLTNVAMVGLAALAGGVIGFTLLLLGVNLPGWVRWLTVACLAAAATLGIRSLLRRDDDTDDDSAVV